MTTTLERPETREADAVPTGPSTFQTPNTAARAQEPRTASDRAAERHLLAKGLAVLADGDREALEALRLRFQRRLHRRSDDFDAAQRLRTVELALSMTPRRPGMDVRQRPEGGRVKRWWRRRRKLSLAA